MAGVKNLDTFSQGPRLTTLDATRLFEGKFFRSEAIACPSDEAEYCTKAPRMPDARRIPAAARLT
jgi:hypothetical protein